MTLNKIKKIQNKMANVVENTPFQYSHELSSFSGYKVFLKKENLQVTGSFKIRGAFNKISILVKNGYSGKIIAASAGNHAQGVAFSAKYFSLPAIIIMPESAPLIKVMGVKDLGAEVILFGRNYDESYVYAKKLAEEKNIKFIHPFEDEDVIDGQGTIALEMLSEIPDLDAIILSVGGGGMISGISRAVQEINPDIKIIAASSSGSTSMRDSFLNKRIKISKYKKTIADGISVNTVSPITFKYISENVTNFYKVNDDEISEAILFLLEKENILVEGAGAVGVSVLLNKKLDLEKGSKIGIILSGGNIDITMLATIIEKGLKKSYRKMKLIVTLLDTIGSLQKLTKILKDLGVNIVQIGYDNSSLDIELQNANISIDIETNNRSHQEEVIKRLTHCGFIYSVV